MPADIRMLSMGSEKGNRDNLGRTAQAGSRPLPHGNEKNSRISYALENPKRAWQFPCWDRQPTFKAIVRENSICPKPYIVRACQKVEKKLPSCMQYLGGTSK
jgi:hypothetical protein